MAQVYLSSKLTEDEQNIVKDLLLNAPKTIREMTNNRGQTFELYGADEPIDYRNFEGVDFTSITSRVEEILGCAKFHQEQVQLYCYKFKGSVESYSTQGSDYSLDVKNEDKIYQVKIPKTILDQLVPSVAAIRGETINILGTELWCILAIPSPMKMMRVALSIVLWAF